MHRRVHDHVHDHVLDHCSDRLEEIFAVSWLVFTAMNRLNGWALLYMVAVGYLRFQQDGSPPTRHWLYVAVLLLISILMQYVAMLSPMPPTVWSVPDRRPWSDMGESWEDARGTCERLASMDPYLSLIHI